MEAASTHLSLFSPVLLHIQVCNALPALFETRTPLSLGLLASCHALILLDAAVRMDRSDLTKHVDDMVRCVYVNICW